MIEFDASGVHDRARSTQHPLSTEASAGSDDAPAGGAQAERMHPVLRQELDRNDGLLAVRGLGVPRWAVSNAIRAGHLERVHPGVYRDPALPPDRLRAAALYVGERGALSHTTALGVWGLTPLLEPVHATVARGVRLRSSPVIAIHSRAAEDLRIVPRRGLAVTPVEDALVDSWPLLPEPIRTAGLIEAVGQRMTIPSRVATAMGRARHLPDRRALRVLVDKLVRGCRSQLELFGLDAVFAGLPFMERQVRMTVGGQTYYLDAYAERHKLNVELDGASWHGSPEQRERDLRRDAALATAGIRVVRFTYRMMVSDPAAVRAQVGRLLGEGPAAR